MNEFNDQYLLAQIPDYLAMGGLLKATPAEEGSHRLLYLEASNEDIDHHDEIVLQKALGESADYYLRHGNIDLSHYSILGAKSGLSNFMEYEIGKPVDVRVDGNKTFVKAELYTGESPMAKNATMVWDSLTKQKPVSRWFPSVGGVVLSKSVRIDPATGRKVAVVDKVRWNNIALDRCPVSKTVPEVSAVPAYTFAKSLNGFVVKALEASSSTDMAQLTGGGALGQQSLDGASHSKAYAQTAAIIANRLRTGKLSPRNIKAYLVEHLGFYDDDAEYFSHAFLTDLQTRRNNHEHN